MPSVRSTETINNITEIIKNQDQKQSTGSPKTNVESGTLYVCGNVHNIH